MKGFKFWAKEQLAIRQKEESLIKLDERLYQMAYEDGFLKARERAYILTMNLAMLSSNDKMMSAALLIRAIGNGEVNEKGESEL